MKITIEYDDGRVVVITAEDVDFLETFLLALEQMRPQPRLPLISEQDASHA